jgi:hypothetical protein
MASATTSNAKGYAEGAKKARKTHNNRLGARKSSKKGII